MSWLTSLLGWFAALFGSKPAVPGSIVADIQAATVSLCKFLPLAESVETLVATSYPADAANVAVVETVAKAICGAVSSKPAVSGTAASAFASPFPATPVSWNVNGVQVQGRFVA